MAGLGRCDQAVGVWGLAPMRSSGRLLGLDSKCCLVMSLFTHRTYVTPEFKTYR